MRIIWKLLSVALTAMLIAGSVAAQETPAPERLTPVQRRAVQAFAADGILDGTSCSLEDCSGTVQRWEVAMWIIRLFNYKPTPHETFADVDSGQPYASYVETLWDEGITVGCRFDPLRFCPERPTNRGQMSAFVTRAYGLDDTDPPHGFLDVSPTHIFRDNISALKNAGILSADCDEGERLFCPWQPIAAAEAVEWLYRAKLRGPTTGNGGGGGGSGGGGGGGNGGGGGSGGGGGGGGGGNPGGGGGDPPPTTTVPPTTTIPSNFAGPGGAEIDMGPDGECTHWGTHVRMSGGPDGKSHLLLDDGGLYAHRHDGNALRWWYWPTPGGQQSPISLLEGDQRIPCHHAECPTDHTHDADGKFTFSAGAHYFVEDRRRVREYEYQENGTWQVGGFSLARVQGPCIHPDTDHH